MNQDLVLVTLSEDQVSKAKNENGKRKQITHALVVSQYGIMYGTEKECRKYYSVWCDIFKNLFVKCYETDCYNLNSFKDSGNVVMSLIEASDEKLRVNKENIALEISVEKKSIFSRIFGV